MPSHVSLVALNHGCTRVFKGISRRVNAALLQPLCDLGKFSQRAHSWRDKL